jgi:hypothetical protein
MMSSKVVLNQTIVIVLIDRFIFATTKEYHMNQSLYVFLSIQGHIITQDLSSEEAGPVIATLLKERAIVLPVICRSESSVQALTLYENKVQNNLEIFELFLNKELVDVT